MTDSHTKSKLWGEGYIATVPINCRATEYLQLKNYYLSSEPNKTHSCIKGSRSEKANDDWLVFLLSFGLQQTAMDLNQMTDLGNGNVLLRQAKLENDADRFSFPKSICSTKDGIICVADTGNNRIVGFNTGGVQIFVLDKFEYRNAQHKLSTPLALCSLVNGNIVVCNYANSTINIVASNGKNRLMFKTTSAPIAVDSDHSGTIFVLTESNDIEEFSRSGKSIRTTKIKNRVGVLYTLMTVAKFSNEIYLGKCNSPEVLVISKWGDSLRVLTLTVTGSGLNVFLSYISLSNVNHILAADSVNRSVHVFDSKTGAYMNTVVNGKSGLGCVQSVCVCDTDLLLTTEYSLNQNHCVKMFSYNVVDTKES